MKKTKKRILGVLGLGAVVATTAFAATLPGPEASAADTTSVTDTITVRVVGSVPNVTIRQMENNEIITVPTQSFAVDYENVEYLTVLLTHKALDGTETTYTLDDGKFVDYYPGTEDYNIHFVED